MEQTVPFQMINNAHFNNKVKSGGNYETNIYKS